MTLYWIALVYFAIGATIGVNWLTDDGPNSGAPYSFWEKTAGWTFMTFGWLPLLIVIIFRMAFGKEV